MKTRGLNLKNGRLIGPGGSSIAFELQKLSLTKPQRVALNKLVRTGDLRKLSTVERELIARKQARVNIGSSQALIVRFDCTWVRID